MAKALEPSTQRDRRPAVIGFSYRSDRFFHMDLIDLTVYFSCAYSLCHGRADPGSDRVVQVHAQTGPRKQERNKVLCVRQLNSPNMRR
jgi:hypothetical protein